MPWRADSWRTKRPICGRAHGWAAWLWIGVVCLLAGCAQPQIANVAPSPSATWTGRLALQVNGDTAQSFSALFELRGSPEQGELALFSPFGSTLARLSWRPDHATLTTSHETRDSGSLDALLQEATGSSIPVQALFSWLQGIPATAPGWQADLSALADGHLQARRSDPAPPATLRIALTR